MLKHQEVQYPKKRAAICRSCAFCIPLLQTSVRAGDVLCFPRRHQDRNLSDFNIICQLPQIEQETWQHQKLYNSFEKIGRLLLMSRFWLYTSFHFAVGCLKEVLYLLRYFASQWGKKNSMKQGSPKVGFGNRSNPWLLDPGEHHHRVWPIHIFWLFMRWIPILLVKRPMLSMFGLFSPCFLW